MGLNRVFCIKYFFHYQFYPCNLRALLEVDNNGQNTAFLACLTLGLSWGDLMHVAALQDK